MQRYDAIIIGSGPAGAAAAINLKVRGKSFLLFGSPALSRKLEAAERIENYLGLPAVSGRELQGHFQAHLRSMGIEILHEQVQMAYPMGDYFSVAAVSQTCEATAVILAPGVFSAKLLDGEEQFLGRGVSYCATCDAPLYRGKTVAVLGYSEDSAGEAEYLSGIAAKTYFVPLHKLSRALLPAIEVLQPQMGMRITGGSSANTLHLGDRTVGVDGVFILRDNLAPASLVPGLEIKDGFIAVDSDMQTNIPGCYAAGDCTGKPHQYMRAAGQGQTAALNAVAYIDEKKLKQQ